MTMSGSRLQFLLSRTDVFTGRIQVVLSEVASQVLVEAGVGATHALRAAYAKAVLANPGNAANNAALYLAQSTNVAGTITMEDEGPRTSVSDASLLAQITSDWNKLAGIDTGS